MNTAPKKLVVFFLLLAQFLIVVYVSVSTSFSNPARAGQMQSQIESNAEVLGVEDEVILVEETPIPTPTETKESAIVENYELETFLP